MNEEPGRYRITKTYVTDPARNVLMIDVRFESLTGKKLGLDALYDPSLGNDHEDDVAEPDGAALLARDTGSPVASAVAGERRRFARTSSTGERRRPRPDRARRRSPACPAASRSPWRSASASTTGAALSAANASLGAGFAATRTAYESGWHRYLGGLKSAARERRQRRSTTPRS